MGYHQPLKHHREWRFKDKGEAAHFDDALAKAINTCLSHLERDGHSFLVSRENTGGVIVRRLESESGELLACVERMMDPAARTGHCLDYASSGVETLIETSGH